MRVACQKTSLERTYHESLIVARRNYELYCSRNFCKKNLKTKLLRKRERKGGGGGGGEKKGGGGARNHWLFLDATFCVMGALMMDSFR